MNESRGTRFSLATFRNVGNIYEDKMINDIAHQQGVLCFVFFFFQQTWFDKSVGGEQHAMNN
jgi:hypothetical protein